MERMDIEAPQLSESETWVMAPSDSWPVFMAGDPNLRLMNAIPDEHLPRYTPPDVTIAGLGINVDVSANDVTDLMDTSSTMQAGVGCYLNVTAIRRLLSVPVTAIYRLWSKLWIRASTEAEDVDDEEEEDVCEREITATRVLQDTEAALGCPRLVPRGRAAMLAAVASDLDRRLRSLPCNASSSTVSPGEDAPSTPNHRCAAGQLKTVADLNRLAGTLKLRLAAVSPSIVERSVDATTGLVEYVDELQMVDGSRQRLVPQYVQDKRTQRLELRSHVPVETIPGFDSTAF